MSSGLSAQRIVTLLPSATEIVCAVGLRDQLVGVTHECDFPSDVPSLPSVTRSAIDHSLTSSEIDAAVREHLQDNRALYTLDVPLLQRLQPDLIVTQALCDVCAVSEDEVTSVLQLLPGPPRLINLEPMSLPEVFDTISLVGHTAGVDEVAECYRASLESRVQSVIERSAQIPQNEKPTVGFLEWTDPLFNGGHWTPELIDYAGGIDSFGNPHQPSQTLSDETLLAADPDVLVIALCGFDEQRAQHELSVLKQRIDFTQLKAHREGRVYVLDGNSYFSRPGPRLVDALEILAHLLHPGDHPGGQSAAGSE
ncbi:MAG: cobalamin-binding protein [Pseudomonadota bacterium]